MRFKNNNRPVSEFDTHQLHVNLFPWEIHFGHLYAIYYSIVMYIHIWHITPTIHSANDHSSETSRLPLMNKNKKYIFHFQHFIKDILWPWPEARSHFTVPSRPSTPPVSILVKQYLILNVYKLINGKTKSSSFCLESETHYPDRYWKVQMLIFTEPSTTYFGYINLNDKKFRKIISI